MPEYTIGRTNTESTDPWADAAKNFLRSPSYADQYMQQANMAVEESQRPVGRPLGYDGNMDAISERDLLAGLLTGEGGSLEDMQYITDVINNRVASGSYPGDLRSVILQPGHFSALNGVTGYAGGEGANTHWQRPSKQAYSVADAFFDGTIGGSTRGALNYYQPDLSNPDWGGDHFYRLPGSSHVFGRAD